MLLIAHSSARVVFSKTQATDLSPLVVLTMLRNLLVSCVVRNQQMSLTYLTTLAANVPVCMGCQSPSG